MIGSTYRRRLLVCWGVSILLHAGLFTFGVTLLIKAARFQVEAGKTSTEMNLIIESIPVAALTSPPRAPPPPPKPQPILAPKLIKSAVLPTPQPTFTTLSPSVDPKKLQPTKPSTKPKAALAKESSTASRGAVEAQPDELHNEPPVYPEDSRAAREQGVVILRVEVTAAGEPSRVTILRSSGYFRLDQAARRAVEHWKFHPALRAGIPVSSEADVPVHFKLQ